jgi:hypothetical protein
LLDYFNCRFIYFIVSVFDFLDVLLRNYLAEKPLLFFIPVSTLALIFIDGSLISNAAYLAKPYITPLPISAKSFSYIGQHFESLLS